MGGVLLSPSDSIASGGEGGVEPQAGASPGSVSASGPVRVPLPPEPFDRVKVWGGLLLSLAVCAIPLMSALGDVDVTSDREARALLTSRETWSRVSEGHRLAWVIPSYQMEQAIDPPPMMTWLHLLAWRWLDPATADPQWLALLARCVSVGMGLLALAATYWAGVSIGGAKVGRLATLSMGTTLLFMHPARQATADAVLLGWVSVSIAAGLWAMRPLKEINWVGRRVLGWLIAGVALAGAVMTKGPTAVVFVLPPLIAAILLTPMRRSSNTVGMVFAVTLGLVLTAPWYLYVLEQVPDAQEKLFANLSPPRDLFVLAWSHFGLLLLLSPWVVWAVGALCQPFLRAADRARRRQLLIAWFWFVLLFVVLSTAAAKNIWDLLPLMPAAGLMVGQLWAYHATLASQRQLDPGVNLLRVPHWLLLGLASIAGPLVLVLQPALIDAGWLSRPALPEVDWPIAAAVGGALLAIALMGTRWHFKWRPRLAAYATTAWVVLAASAGYFAYSRSPAALNPFRDDAAQVSLLAAGHSLAYLPDAQRRGRLDALDPAFVFYLGRHAEPIDIESLNEATGPGEASAVPDLVIASDRAEIAAQMEAAGFDRILAFSDHARTHRQLYRHRPTP